MRVIGVSKLTFEEFTTGTTVIESCLISGPISLISGSEEDAVALTPGHFLIGSAFKPLAEPFDEPNKKVIVCSRWKMLILMRNRYWKRSYKENLSQIQERER